MFNQYVILNIFFLWMFLKFCFLLCGIFLLQVAQFFIKAEEAVNCQKGVPMAKMEGGTYN